MTDFDEQVPDESEQLDQLETDRTLANTDASDPLDEGYSAPDHYSAAEGFGNTAEEMAEGESLDRKLAEERPEPDPFAPDEDRDEASTDPTVGDELADLPGDALLANPALDGADEVVVDDVDVDDLASTDPEPADLEPGGPGSETLGPDGEPR